jgi:hypothetical protein
MSGDPPKPDIASGETGDKTKLDRVLAGDEYDRHRRCRRLGHRGNLFAGRCDYCDLAANQIGRHLQRFMYGHSRSQKPGAGMVGECIGVAYVARQNVDALVPRDRTHLEN